MTNGNLRTRTLMTGCGWTRKGNPSQVKKLYEFHKKYCESCSKSEHKDYELNDFKMSNANNIDKNNGKYISTLVTDGFVFNNTLKVNNGQQALNYYREEINKNK